MKNKLKNPLPALRELKDTRPERQKGQKDKQGVAMALVILPSIAPGSAHPAPVEPGPAHPGPADSAHLYLIDGSFEEIERYAGTTAAWIIKAAHLICDPLREGRVYTHTTGTANDWLARPRTDTWREVAPDDPLLPGIYEFHSESRITLSQISERQGRSRTSAASISNSTTFKRRVLRRDGNECVVCKQWLDVTASHLIPKRIGTDGIGQILTRFCGERVALGADRYDPRIGISLVPNLDNRVDSYELGFYHTMDNTYIAHNFFKGCPNLSIYGTAPDANTANLPILHLHSITLYNNGETGTLPDSCIFDWHYLQCLLKAFGTDDYRNILGMRFFVHPFKTDSDSDSSDGQYTDIDESDPPWPSYHLDKFLMEQGEKQMARELREVVAKWSSEVASTNSN